MEHYDIEHTMDDIMHSLNDNYPTWKTISFLWKQKQTTNRDLFEYSMVGDEEFESPTSSTSMRRSSQLS